MLSLWTKKIWQNSYLYGISRFCLLFVCLSVLTACGGVYHTVKPGQTLYRISRTYGVSETSIIRLNKISDPTKVRSGSRIYIPGARRVLNVPVVKQTATVKKPSAHLSPSIKTATKAQTKKSFQKRCRKNQS